MRKIFLILFISSSSFVNSFSQDFTKDFEISLPTFKVHNSLYNKISFLDSRIYKLQIGVISIGPLRNRDARLILKEPFTKQLTNILNALIDSTAKDGELLFQLKRFNYVEPRATRFCSFSAELYSRQGNQYQRVSSIDTIIMVSGYDITSPLIVRGSKIITDLIANNLSKNPIDSTYYNIAQVEHIDSIDKRKIPLYNTANYKDGLYRSYKSFMNQTPDEQGMVNMKKDETISSIKIIDSTGNKVKIKSKDIYAVVSKGFPFIATEYGYYQLQHMGDDFFFTGDVKVAASVGDVVTGQIVFGVIGALSNASGNQTTFQMIIDYKTGKFIHLRKIEPVTQ